MSAHHRRATAKVAVVTSGGFGLTAKDMRASAQADHAYVTMLLALYPALATVAIAAVVLFGGAPV
jgi:hypothetical protein